MKRVIWSVVFVLALALPVAGTVLASRVTVAVTATALATSVPGNPTAVALVNQCTASVYIGGSGVTTAAGLELTTGSTLSVILYPEETIYGIVAADTCRVDVLQNRR